MQDRTGNPQSLALLCGRRIVRVMHDATQPESHTRAHGTAFQPTRHEDQQRHFRRHVLDDGRTPQCSRRATVSRLRPKLPRVERDGHHRNVPTLVDGDRLRLRGRDFALPPARKVNGRGLHRTPESVIIFFLRRHRGEQNNRHRCAAARHTFLVGRAGSI